MSKSDYVTAEGHMAELQCKHTNIELCNRKKVGLKTKSIKSMPKILNYSLGIINVFLNVNKRMRQKTILEKKTISRKFQYV
jgi:hypothetical protein